ncbi:MAG: hypothetical protein IJH98_07445, partial [Solobacterium sp.]|nr:hypothetical protein [Solobacterium sp.]
RLEILEEGTVRKFLKHVQQVTFAGGYVKPDQKVLYVTERCVFELIDGKMVLTETAPGVDLQKDILDQMDFVPEISAELKQMDDGLFREDWGSLRKILTEGGNA